MLHNDANTNELATQFKMKILGEKWVRKTSVMLRPVWSARQGLDSRPGQEAPYIVPRPYRIRGTRSLLSITCPRLRQPNVKLVTRLRLESWGKWLGVLLLHSLGHSFSWSKQQFYLCTLIKEDRDTLRRVTGDTACHVTTGNTGPESVICNGNEKGRNSLFFFLNSVTFFFSRNQ